MELDFREELDNFINVISDDEKKRNHHLKRRIDFLTKYIGNWKEDHMDLQFKKQNPNPFIMKKEKKNV